MAKDGPKSRAEMAADLAREVGLLILVFGVLDPLIDWHRAHFTVDPSTQSICLRAPAPLLIDFPWGFMLVMISVGLVSYVVGQEIERARKP